VLILYITTTKLSL